MQLVFSLWNIYFREQDSILRVHQHWQGKLVQLILLLTFHIIGFIYQTDIFLHARLNVTGYGVVCLPIKVSFSDNSSFNQIKLKGGR